MAEVFVVSVTQPNPPFVSADHNDPKRLVIHGDTVYLGDEHVSPEDGVKVLDGEAARIEEGRFVWTAGTSTVSVYDAEVVDEEAKKRSEASKKAARTRKRNAAKLAKAKAKTASKGKK